MFNCISVDISNFFIFYSVMQGKVAPSTAFKVAKDDEVPNMEVLDWLGLILYVPQSPHIPISVESISASSASWSV